MQRFIALLGSNFGTRTMTTMLRYFGPAFALLGLLLTSATGFSQVFIMANETAETCTGTFVDAGNAEDGTGNPYPDENFTYTLCPNNPGDAVSVQFVAFGLETNPNPNNSDYLFIYDGPDAGSPSMGNYTGNALQGLPVTATVNNPTGCLTFVFSGQWSRQCARARLGSEHPVHYPLCNADCSEFDFGSSIVKPRLYVCGGLFECAHHLWRRWFIC